MGSVEERCFAIADDERQGGKRLDRHGSLHTQMKANKKYVSVAVLIYRLTLHLQALRSRSDAIVIGGTS